MDNFLILGNGCSGSSLLQSVLNSHSQIICEFEAGESETLTFLRSDIAKVRETWIERAEKANNQNKLWGNKIPTEQFIWRKMNTNSILEFCSGFKIIFNLRSHNGYKQCAERRFSQVTSRESTDYWLASMKLYFELICKCKYGVILNTFEQFLLNPEKSAKRLCGFLGVEYEEDMLNGVAKQPQPYYPKSFNKNRIIT